VVKTFIVLAFLTAAAWCFIKKALTPLHGKQILPGVGHEAALRGELALLGFQATDWALSGLCPAS